MVTGEVQLRSPWMSNEWRLTQSEVELARIRRHGRLYVSDVLLPDGTKWLLEPAGPGVVRAVEPPGVEFARVVRRSQVTLVKRDLLARLPPPIGLLE